jgi:DNA polymerase III sliding clamp (beta) subunit (PCNA family)
MSASKYDFSIEQGTSFKMVLRLKNNDGTPMDINGWCARLIWKTNNNITQIFSTENVDFEIYKFTLDPSDSSITLLIPANTTNNLSFNSAKYDLELQTSTPLYTPQGGNHTTRILFGVINIVKRFSGNKDLLDCSL